MNWTRIRKQLGGRTAIVGAGVAGFLIGAGGFVAAQIDDSPSAEHEAEVEVEADDTSTTIDDSSGRTNQDDSKHDDDATPTSIDLTIPTTTVDDDGDDDSTSSMPTTTIDDDSDDDSTSSVPTSTIDDDDSDDDHGDDDSTSSMPTTSVDDDSDDDSTSSVPTSTIDDDDSDDDDSNGSSLPDPFSRSYESAGGSIDVTWTGTAFVLNSVSPAPGFVAEIEDQAWDRVRVDFEGSGESRIEVRLHDGQIRVRID